MYHDVAIYRYIVASLLSVPIINECPLMTFEASMNVSYSTVTLVTDIQYYSDNNHNMYIATCTTNIFLMLLVLCIYS